VTEQTFADRLKALRAAAGISQQELADKAGMHRFGVAKLERGERKPTWDTVQALAKALGVSCEAFTQEPAEREPPGPGRPRKESPLAETEKTEEKPKGKKKGKG
jgi:transcriptional regulator with XRE-family HTH domain